MGGDSELFGKALERAAVARLGAVWTALDTVSDSSYLHSNRRGLTISEKEGR